MLTGVILAGGSNRRMGGKMKSLLLFGGISIIHRQIFAMKKICDEIILVTNEPRAFLPEVNNAIRIITDSIPGKGPLSGMHAAFSLSQYSHLWVVGGDMPFISDGLALKMWNQKKDNDCDAVIPFVDDHAYPLHGIYDKSTVKVITSMLSKNETRLMDFLSKIKWEKASADLFANDIQDYRYLYSIETEADYVKALEMDEEIVLPK